MRRLFFDLKFLFKKPLLFILLFTGMVIGAFSLITYYVASTADLKNIDAAFMIDHVIEFRADADIYAGDKLLSLIEDKELPEVYYADIAVYSNPDFDIFAVYYNKAYDASHSGRFISPEDMGQRNAVVTYDLEKEHILINGNKFGVVGVVKNDGYAPDIYDYRRIPNGEEYVAGVEYARDSDIIDRPENGVFIPLDMLDEINAYPNYYHITFEDALTDAQRRECEEVLTEAFGENYIEFTDMTPYSEIHSAVKYVMLLIYAAAICMGIVNIIALFNYFLEISSKNYAVYKMLGASSKDIFFIITGELLFLSLISFIAGGILSFFFVKYSGFVSSHLSVSFFEIILLFIVYFLISFLLGLKKIRKTVKGNVVSLSRKTVNTSDNNNVLVSNRHMYLLSFKYNKSTISGTLSLAFLSFICAFTFVFAMCYVAESDVFGRYVSKVYNNEIGIYCPCESEYSEKTRIAKEKNDTGFLDLYKKRFTSLKGIKDVGAYQSHSFFTKIDENMFVCDYGDKVFWENSQYPLYKGSWQPLIDYNEERTIPIVVDYEMGKKYPVGSEITFDVCYEYIEEIEGYFEDGLPYGHSYEKYTPVEHKVVGILDENAFVIIGNPDFQMGAQITHYLGKPSEAYDNGFAGHICSPFYSIGELRPVFTSEFERVWYIFSEGNADKYVETWNEQIKDIGMIDTFGMAVKNYKDSFRNGGGNVYFMHAIVSGMLLISGVGGYSLIIFLLMRKQFGVYYLCGMPWRYAVNLLVTGNALDIICPGVLGIVCGIFLTSAFRTFSKESSLIAVLSGIALIAAIFFITSLFVVLYTRNKSPNKLLIKED